MKSNTLKTFMTPLNKLSIPQLIARLNSLGVEWVGSTTRKAPLIETINRFAYNADYLYNDKEAELTAKELLKGLGYPVCNLVGLLRYWGQSVTSDEVADPYALQQRVLEIARQKYPPAVAVTHEPISESILRGVSQPVTEPLPNLDKVLGYSMAEFSAMPSEALRGCCKVLELIGSHTALYNVTKRCEALIHIKERVACLRQETSRNLLLDTKNCQWAFKTSTASHQKLPDNIWCAKEGERVRHNQTFYSVVVKGLRQRGFYEPDIHHSGKLEGVYLCCKLEDKPLPSLDKVLSIPRNELLDSPPAFLLDCHKVMGTYYPEVSKRLGVPELTRQLIPAIAGMRRRPDRDLVFDPAGCQYVYESKTGFQFKIAEDMWETPTKPLYHALVLQDLKERGFYEPDCVTDALHGLYLVCDLADAPPILQIGDIVRLKTGLASVPIEGLPKKWFSSEDTAKVVDFYGTHICRLEIVNRGLSYFFSTYHSSLVKKRDSEEKSYFKPGDRVTLKPGTKSLTSFTRKYDWFSPGDVGTIEKISPTEFIIKAIRGATVQRFKANPKDLQILTLR